LNWGEFWLRRFWRLYPPYLAAIVVSLAAAFFVHDRHPEIRESIGTDLSTHLFMVHNLTHNYSDGLANGAFWSLGMEEQLYGLYFLLFLMIRRRSYRIAVSVAAITTIAWRSIVPAFPESYLSLGSWGLWPFSFWLHWTLGACAVDAWFRNYRLPRWCASFSIGLTAICLGMLANQVTFEFLSGTGIEPVIAATGWSGNVAIVSSLGELICAVGFFCVLNWCVQLPKDHYLIRSHHSRMAAWLGRISYSVYLVHVPTIFVLEELIPFGNSAWDWIGRLLLYVSVSVATGGMFYGAVEQWFLAGRCPRFGRSLQPAPGLPKSVKHEA
jgi:peptidoglycan/LPS O-acetylase OafA/YrhL